MRETPAIDSLRDLLERQLRALERSGPGVASGADPEDLHRFRVATRRTRALIRASRPNVDNARATASTWAAPSAMSSGYSSSRDREAATRTVPSAIPPSCTTRSAIRST